MERCRRRISKSSAGNSGSRYLQSSETVMLIRVGAVILALLTTAEPAWAAPPNKVPTVSLTAPMNGATFGAPATISISANASDSDGTISRVDLSGRNVTWHADGCPLHDHVERRRSGELLTHRSSSRQSRC